MIKKGELDSLVWWTRLEDTFNLVQHTQQLSVSAEIVKGNRLPFIMKGVQVMAWITNASGYWNTPNEFAEFAINDFAGYTPSDPRDNLEIIDSYGALASAESIGKINCPTNGQFIPFPESFYTTQRLFVNVFLAASIGYQMPELSGTENWLWRTHIAIHYETQRQ